MLVVAAGLFMRTFSSLANLHLGFDRDRVLLVTRQRAADARFPPAERLATYDRIRQSVAAVPGVAAAAVSFVTPVSGNTWNNRIDVSGGVELPERQRAVELQRDHARLVHDVRHAARRRPRHPRHATRKNAPPVILVNQAFARKFLNGASPLGHTVTIGAGGPVAQPPREIVGVVADAVYRSLREPIPPTMYVPLAQFDDSRNPAPPSMSVSVRAAVGSPPLLARSVVCGDCGRQS